MPAPECARPIARHQDEVSRCGQRSGRPAGPQDCSHPAGSWHRRRLSALEVLGQANLTLNDIDICSGQCACRARSPVSDWR